MNKQKLDFKLLNILIIVAIVCLLYTIRGLWMGLVGTIFNICLPFLIAFGIAYAIYPILRKLQEKGLPKWLSILTLVVVFLGFIIIIVVILVPLLYEQTLLLLSNISKFIQDISTKYELNLGFLQTSISSISSDILKSVGSQISNGAISIITSSIGVITSGVIICFVAIYFLSDMEKIRRNLKRTLKGFGVRQFNYVKALDTEISNYFVGMGKNMMVQFIEYTLAFLIIGHPNYLLLGLLAAVTNILPYIGGFIVNIVAIVIASVISPQLLLLTLVVCLICPNLDSYVIGPRIYGKTNKLHPLVSIFAVFAGGMLWGIMGIIVSVPVAIIIITTYKFLKKDIDEKIVEIKERN